MENGMHRAKYRNLIYWLVTPAALGAIVAGVVTLRSGGGDVADSDNVRPVQSATVSRPEATPARAVTPSRALPDSARSSPASKPDRFVEQARVQSCPASPGLDDWARTGSARLSDLLKGWVSGSETACGVRSSIEAGLRQSVGVAIDTLVRFCGAFFQRG